MLRVVLLFEHPTLNGGERSVLASVERLRGRFEFEAFAPDGGPLRGALEEAGVVVRGSPLVGENGERLRRVDGIASLVTAVRESGADVLHGNSLAMGRLTGAVAPYVAPVCTAHLRDIIGLSASAVRELNGNARLVAVSEATRGFHVAQGVEAGRTVVAHTGVDVERFRPRGADGGFRGEPGGDLRSGRVAGSGDPATTHDGRTRHPLIPGPSPQGEGGLIASTSGGVRRSLGIPEDAPVVLTVGQIGLRKGWDVLAEAAVSLGSSFPALHVVLAGERYSEKAETVAYEREVRERFEGAMPGRVRFVGYRGDMPELMNAADLLVHPARQEPFGRVLLEAAASGLAIVATDVGGTRELLEDGGSARLVPAGDPVALAGAMAELIGDAELRDRLAGAARRRVEVKFTAEAAAERLARVWEGVLAERRA